MRKLQVLHGVLYSEAHRNGLKKKKKKKNYEEIG